MDGGRPVRILVVDDQRPFRAIAARVAARTPGFELVGQADSGAAAVAAVDELRPDLVLMDVQMPGMSGVEAAGLLSRRTPQPVVVLCSTYARADLPFPIDSPGVAAYLHKEELRPQALHDLWARLAPA